MLAYLGMFSVPGFLAVAGIRRSIVLLLVVAFIYWLMIGFRFHVGMDWNNYVYIYSRDKDLSLSEVLISTEPAFRLLIWIAEWLGGGLILVNIVSALVFCWGFFVFARHCPEPFLAIVVATPLLVVAFAMSGTRQAMAIGVISYLYATWERRGVLGRVGIVLLASLFHFSAIFALMFVALSARASVFLKIVAAGTVAGMLAAIVYVWPSAMEAYSRLYVTGARQLTAPGAIVQTGVIALAGGAYLLSRKRWAAAYGNQPLYFNLAVASILAVPAVYLSSVGAYRFALYLWPLAMYVWSGFPGLILNGLGRLFCRLTVVCASGVLLIGWLTFANNSFAWLPYQNWLLRPAGVSLKSHGPAV